MPLGHYAWQENPAHGKLPKIEPGDKVILHMREGGELRLAQAVVTESETVSSMLSLNVEAVFDSLGDARSTGHPLEGEKLSLPESYVYEVVH